MSKPSLTFIAYGLILGMLAGLLGWYVFIERARGTINSVDSGRGLSIGIPTFGGGLGSINQNTALSFTKQKPSNISSTTPAEAATSTQKEISPQALVQIQEGPAAGVSFSRTGTSTRGFVVDRVSGNIFSIDPTTGVFSRITNTLIPYVYETHWIDDEYVILRHVGKKGTAATFLGKVRMSTTSPTGELVGDYLEEGIVSVVANKEARAYFTIVPTKESSCIGVVTQLGKKTVSRRVWESSVCGFSAQWNSKNSILLSQFGSEGLSGNVIALDLSKKTEDLLVSDEPGLSLAHGSSQDTYLYSTSQNGTLHTYLKNKKGVFRLGVRTLGEKCVFSKNMSGLFCAVPEALPERGLPDAWYRGEIHFSDSWWRIDTESGAAEKIFLEDSGSNIDVKDPSIDEAGLFVAFLDNTTGAPWVLRLE